MQLLGRVGQDQWWYLSTWNVNVYRIPSTTPIEALVVAMLSSVDSTPYRVPAEIVTEWGLVVMDPGSAPFDD